MLILELRFETGLSNLFYTINKRIKCDGQTNQKVEKSLEELLWDSANKLRGTVVSYDYMNVCLGLIF